MPLLPRRNIAALAVVVVLSACSLPQDAAEERQILRGANDPQATFAVEMVTRVNLKRLASWPNSHPVPNLGWITHSRTSPDPLIEPGDSLDLAIWDNDDTSLLTAPGQKVVQMPGLKVSSTGTVFVPYVDEVYVAKMTPDQARTAIQTKLLSIIPSAQVQLAFAGGSNNSVQVVSGLPKPGTYPLPDRNTTVTELLALAGGLATTTGNPQVNLTRDGKQYRVAAETLLKNPDLNTTLRGGDTIFVEPDQRYFLSLGAAGREAVINFPRDRVTAIDAMALVGGLVSTTANPKGILILRSYPQSDVRHDDRGPSRDRMVFALDLTTADGLFSAGEFAIQDHDLVLVTQSDLVNTKTIVNLAASLFGVTTSADTAAAHLTN